MQQPTDSYTHFYHLREEPFSTQMAPDAIYLSPSHAVALEQVCQGIIERHGFIALLGEGGLGKTTLLRSYLNEADPQLVKVIYIATATPTFEDVLTSIAQAFGREPQVHPLSHVIAQLHQLFTSEYEQERNIVLVMDDAHNIPNETLEHLPVLSNVVRLDAKLIQIVLVGHPIVAHHLQTVASLHRLKDQMRTIVQLHPLSEAESIGYIQQRLYAVATIPSEVFSQATLRQVVQHARGIPKNLNCLCTDVLRAGFRHKKNPIPFDIARRVIDLPAGTRRAPRWRPVVWLSAGAGVLLLVILMGIFLPRKPVPALSDSPVVVESPAPNQTAQLNTDEKPTFDKTSPETPQEAIEAPQEPIATPPEPIPTEPPEGKARVQALLEQIFPNKGDFQLQVWADKGANAVYTEGSQLAIRVTSGIDAYLQFDYYQANDKVVHLMLDPWHHTITKAEKVIPLGKIGAPFGEEMLIIIASQQQLPPPFGAPEESAEAYLAGLQQRLEQYKSQSKVAIAHLSIRTQKN